MSLPKTRADIPPSNVHLDPDKHWGAAVRHVARIGYEAWQAEAKRDHDAHDRAKGAEGGEHVKLLNAGMKAWLAEAKAKWLRAGGYGFLLSPADVAEIRAAGFEPASIDPESARIARLAGLL